MFISELCRQKLISHLPTTGGEIVVVTWKVANPIPNTEGILILYLATTFQIAVVILITVQEKHSDKSPEHPVCAMGY